MNWFDFVSLSICVLAYFFILTESFFREKVFKRKKFGFHLNPRVVPRIYARVKSDNSKIESVYLIESVMKRKSKLHIKGNFKSRLKEGNN